MLKARGMVFYRLETWGDNGDLKFSCAIPNRQNPNIRRMYEALAHDPLVALQSTLDQVDRDPH
jgi:hypothetical protein